MSASSCQRHLQRPSQPADDKPGEQRQTAWRQVRQEEREGRSVKTETKLVCAVAEDVGLQSNVHAGFFILTWLQDSQLPSYRTSYSFLLPPHL